MCKHGIAGLDCTVLLKSPGESDREHPALFWLLLSSFPEADPTSLLCFRTAYFPNHNILKLFYFSLCVYCTCVCCTYVCRYTCVCLCRCTVPMCTCVEARRGSWVLPSLILHIRTLRQDFSLDLFPLGCWPASSQDPSPSAGAVGAPGHTWLFTRVLGIRTRVLCLCRKCPYPVSHLSGPDYLFY